MREFLTYLQAHMPDWVGGGIVSALMAAQRQRSSAVQQSPAETLPALFDAGVNTVKVLPRVASHGRATVSCELTLA
jgi:hypothetical protein